MTPDQKKIDSLMTLQKTLQANLLSTNKTIQKTLLEIYPFPTTESLGLFPIGTWTMDRVGSSFGSVVIVNKEDINQGLSNWATSTIYCGGDYYTKVLKVTGWEYSSTSNKLKPEEYKPLPEGIDWESFRMPKIKEIRAKLSRKCCEVLDGSNKMRSVYDIIENYGRPKNKSFSLDWDGYGSNKEYYKYTETLTMPDDLGIAGMAWYTKEQAETQNRIAKMFAGWNVEVSITEKNTTTNFIVNILPSIRKR